ncbi:MAG: hypothetical protein OJF49_000978 [Ktedonobacterales bacterium]|jgi:DNA-binding beta-propeller fold protein YncE|nr:MAG: hypothetical protein OJF49_000978 [Ktedonobacterales bacterium]
MLQLRRHIAIPPGTTSEFDHGDVHLATGRVYVAHTAVNTVEMLDGEQGQHLMTLPGCPEGSGVICAQDAGVVFAAARGAGKLLAFDVMTGALLCEVEVGPRPNGLTWDAVNKRLLVADVQENTARLLDFTDPRAGGAGRVHAIAALPGRPRWCVYDYQAERFLVNIREPACVVALDAHTAQVIAQFPISSAGPHGLDIDSTTRQAFIACDAASVVALDLTTGQELASTPIAGPPDAIWFNRKHSRLYVAIDQPGVLEVVNTRSMTIEQHIPTEDGTHTTAYDDQRQLLYVFLPDTCRAVVYEEV